MPILPVTDLNLKTRICEASLEFALGINPVRRQISFCAIDGVSDDSYFSTDRQVLRRRPKVQTSSCRNQLIPEAGTFYGMDRGYLDYTWLSQFHQSGAFCVIRVKSNLKIQRPYSRQVDRFKGLLRSDSYSHGIRKWV